MNFYERDAEFVNAVAAYVLEGLTSGDSIIVVATERHRTAVDEALRSLDADPAEARATGRYVSLDAAGALTQFMVRGSPDPGRFAASIGGVISDIAVPGSHVRVFGEMVALLWEQDNVAGAIELESLWNDLAATLGFSLLCAYPTTVLDTSGLSDLGRVCDLHSRVVPPLRYRSPHGVAEAAGGAQRTEVFVPVPEAVSAVRRFVTSVLREWGEDALVADAALVTSEMATNAVTHAHSPFRAFIHRSDDVVFIAIKDASSGRAQRQSASATGLNGRGLAIVDAVADRWGCDALEDGKVVWAEFAVSGVPAEAPAVPATVTTA